MQPILITDWALFLGRFHPVLVHLPIGFLLLAVILEWWPRRESKSRNFIALAWGLGAAGAVVSALCGWLLASDGEYGGDSLFWHRWLGVSVAVLAVVGTYLARENRKVNKPFGALVAGLLLFAGHQGGNLTHGESFLWAYAPPFIQQMVGHEADATTTDLSGLAADSIPVYATFIQPLLNQKCIQCHNADKQNGGLRLDTPTHLFAGGESGHLISDDPTASLWIKRITLPRSNEKAMPPQGAPVNYTDIELLSWWMEEGADTLALIDPATVPEHLQALLLRDYGLDLSPKTFVEKVTVAHLTEEQLASINDGNWQVSTLAAESGAIDVKVRPGKSVTPEDLDRLLSVAADQVVWLSLEKQQLSGHFGKLAGFPNLNRLKLNHSDVANEDLARLTELEHLESLNLYGTSVDDGGFVHLAAMPELERIYLWQTGVSREAVAKFREAHPERTVNTGFQFAEIEEQTSK